MWSVCAPCLTKLKAKKHSPGVDVWKAICFVTCLRQRESCCGMFHAVEMFRGIGIKLGGWGGERQRGGPGNIFWLYNKTIAHFCYCKLDKEEGRVWRESECLEKGMSFVPEDSGIRAESVGCVQCGSVHPLQNPRFFKNNLIIERNRTMCSFWLSACFHQWQQNKNLTWFLGRMNVNHAHWCLYWNLYFPLEDLRRSKLDHLKYSCC